METVDWLPLVVPTFEPPAEGLTVHSQSGKHTKSGPIITVVEVAHPNLSMCLNHAAASAISSGHGCYRYTLRHKNRDAFLYDIANRSDLEVRLDLHEGLCLPYRGAPTVEGVTQTGQQRIRLVSGNPQPTVNKNGFGLG